MNNSNPFHNNNFNSPQQHHEGPKTMSKGKNNPYYPPPKPRVCPGEGGAVETPSECDVLSGRGGAVNTHKGNIRCRHLVNLMKYEYLNPHTKKMQKSHIAAKIVWTIRSYNPPGRFLKENKTTGMWEEIGDAAAFRKVSQALRENSSEFRSCFDHPPGKGDVGERSGDHLDNAAGRKDNGSQDGGIPYWSQLQQQNRHNHLASNGTHRKARAA